MILELIIKLFLFSEASNLSNRMGVEPDRIAYLICRVPTASSSIITLCPAEKLCAKIHSLPHIHYRSNYCKN